MDRELGEYLATVSLVGLPALGDALLFPWACCLDWPCLSTPVPAKIFREDCAPPWSGTFSSPNRSRSLFKAGVGVVVLPAQPLILLGGFAPGGDPWERLFWFGGLLEVSDVSSSDMEIGLDKVEPLGTCGSAAGAGESPC